MVSLKAKIRKEIGRKVKGLREKGSVPGILYGPNLKNLALEVDGKEFASVYKTARESTLVSLEIENKKFLVIIHAVDFNAILQRPIHIDFYQPNLDKEITVTIPLVFEGEAKACKDLGGTLVRNIQELEVKALPQNLPHEIKVSIEKLESFEDNIQVKDLALPAGVKILKESEEIVALVLAPANIEEELAKPVEEKVEEVERVEKKKEEVKEEEAK